MCYRWQIHNYLHDQRPRLLIFLAKNATICKANRYNFLSSAHIQTPPWDSLLTKALASCYQANWHIDTVQYQ